jgi:hypothetical protein
MRNHWAARGEAMMSAVQVIHVAPGARFSCENKVAERWSEMAPVVLLISAGLVAAVFLALAAWSDFGTTAFLLG